MLPCEIRSSLTFHHFLLQKNIQQNWFDRINLIFWYRNQDTIPFYTVDARRLNELIDDDNSAINDTILTNPVVRHITNDYRMHMDLSTSTPLLTIQNITENDNGLYRCRVEHLSRRMYTTSIQLTVIGQY